jgi:hypothetical protein
VDVRGVELGVIEGLRVGVEVLTAGREGLSVTFEMGVSVGKPGVEEVQELIAMAISMVKTRGKLVFLIFQSHREHI